MDLFSTVKTNISTIDAAERYGIEVKRNGKALCPFHNDRHPSLFVADDHYHCFACGEHGDSIDLVAKLYDLPLHAAARKLASDFGLTPDKPPAKDKQEKIRQRSEAQRLRENEKLCFSALMEYRKLLLEWKRLYAPKTPEEEWHPHFIEACNRLDYVEYLVDTLISGVSYERNEVIEMLMTDSKLKKLQEHLKKHRKEELTNDRRKDADLALWVSGVV